MMIQHELINLDFPGKTHFFFQRAVITYPQTISEYLLCHALQDQTAVSAKYRHWCLPNLQSGIIRDHLLCAVIASVDHLRIHFDSLLIDRCLCAEWFPPDTRRWFNVRPASQTLAEHGISIGTTSRPRWVCCRWLPLSDALSARLSRSTSPSSGNHNRLTSKYTNYTIPPCKLALHSNTSRATDTRKVV